VVLSIVEAGYAVDKSVKAHKKYKQCVQDAEPLLDILNLTADDAEFIAVFSYHPSSLSITHTHIQL
jgi:hypothetical protein